VTQPLPPSGHDSDFSGIESRLRGAVESGKPILAVLDAWSALEAFANKHEDALFDVLEAAANLDPSVGSAASLMREQAGLGLVTRGSREARSDERFRRWIGDPRRNPTSARLVRQARLGKPVVGLVPTDAASVYPVLAAQVSPGSKWSDLVADSIGQAGEGDVILIAFAPSRSKDLVIQAARAIGLSALEAELIAALVEEPSVESAAYRLGLSVDAAREAMRRAIRRTGARNASQLVGRVIDLGSGMADHPFHLPHGADPLLGLTASETRLARLIADGRSGATTARELGLSAETVKSYRRTIFAKLGINRTRDLRRLMTDTRALQDLDHAVEVHWRPHGSGELRLLADADGRSIAFIAYGQAARRPLILFHGSTTGRLIAPPMLAALEGAGYQVLVPQRPGFGLTSPARGGFLETAAADVALILDRLRIDSATLIGRDGGVATAMAFSVRHPQRVRRGLMVNPRRPRGESRTVASPLDALTAILLSHPRLADPFARMITRQTREDVLRRLLAGVYDAVEADRACAERPEVMHHLIADLRGLVGRSAIGYAAEHQVFAAGWAPDAAFDASAWTFAFSGELWPSRDLDVWRRISAIPLEVAPGAGQLIQFTHAEVLANLLEG
jgi:pimeloyl-ACP methyl ester carboxylesterase